MASGPRGRPSLAWYWVAGAIGVVGVLAAAVVAVVGVVGFIDRIQTFQRVAVPGVAELTLEEGGYVVYHEAPGVDDDGGPAVPAPEVTVTSAADRRLPLSDYNGSFTYNAAGHEGRAIATFRVDEPGVYRLGVEAGDGATGTVAVGPGLGWGFASAVVAALLIFFVSLGIGAVIALVTGLRRSQARPATSAAASART
jgi:hypothetical protein